MEPELETESENQSSRIEPTKAEEEAISRGLQVNLQLCIYFLSPNIFQFS